MSNESAETVRLSRVKKTVGLKEKQLYLISLVKRITNSDEDVLELESVLVRSLCKVLE